jgi:hypothetical protein
VPKHLLIVETNCTDGDEDEFNRWYDEVHVPELLQIPGFNHVSRYRATETQPSRRPIEQRYIALYEVEAADARAALDALDAHTPQLNMSDTLRTGRGEVRMRVYESLSE